MECLLQLTVVPTVMDLMMRHVPTYFFVMLQAALKLDMSAYLDCVTRTRRLHHKTMECLLQLTVKPTVQLTRWCVPTCIFKAV